MEEEEKGIDLTEVPELVETDGEESDEGDDEEDDKKE